MTETVNQAVETPAPDANVTPEVEDVAAPSPDVADTDEIANKAKGVGKRIDELTRLRRDAERDRDHWREMAMRNQQTPQPELQRPEEKLKVPADFDFDDGKYQSYIFEQAEKRATEAAKRELTAERERHEADRRRTSFHTRSTAFAKTVEDYESVARNPHLPVSADMAEVIQDSDDGPALLYHLGKNPDIAEKIAQLPPKAAARELGKIEARLAFEREKAKEAKAAISKAPAPTPKLEGADPGNLSVKPDDPDSDKLSDDEWTRRRNKQIEKRRST